MSVTESTPRSAEEAMMKVVTISGAWRSHMVQRISTAEHASQPMIPHSLLLERLSLSADRRDLNMFIFKMSLLIYATCT